MSETEMTAVLNDAFRRCGIDMRARIGRKGEENTVYFFACDREEADLDGEDMEELMAERRHVGLTMWGGIDVVSP